jgi:hypothetical protein
MASKKYKGKLCVYGCGRPATTPDHVFAREFFLPGTVYEPIKVPACIKCNNDKSQLEHYLTTLLPFGGRHKDAQENLAQMVPKRLAHNERLRRLISKRQKTVWIKDAGGLYVPTMGLPLDFQLIERLFRFITVGLVWHHWKIRLTSKHFVTVLALSQKGVEVFDRKFFRAANAQNISNDLGNGTFVYEAVQGADNAFITAWKYSVYGGLTLGGDPKTPNEGSAILGAMTGPSELLSRAELLARFGPAEDDSE